MVLASPLPDVLNVRDRQLYGPDETSQCFGLLTTKAIPKVGPINYIYRNYIQAGNFSADLLIFRFFFSKQCHRKLKKHKCGRPFPLFLQLESCMSVYRIGGPDKLVANSVDVLCDQPYVMGSSDRLSTQVIFYLLIHLKRA